MGRNLENRKKPKSVRMTITIGLNSKNIVKIVDVFNDSIVIDSNYRE